MGAIVELSDPEWKRIEHLFDPTGRRGAPARYGRRDMVEAMLFLARTGCQWRYLPTHYPPWPAVWQQWRRWRETGAWARAMRLIADEIRSRKRAHVQPTIGRAAPSDELLPAVRQVLAERRNHRLGRDHELHASVPVRDQHVDGLGEELALNPLEAKAEPDQVPYI